MAKRSFAYHTLMATLWGVIALRLADAPIISLSPPDLASVRSLTGFTGFVFLVDLYQGGDQKSPPSLVHIQQAESLQHCGGALPIRQRLTP